MLTTLPTPPLPPSRPGRVLRALSLALLGSVIAGCADEEPRYLPPLPDLGSPTPKTLGLPCEVAKLLAERCLGCHGQPPAASPLALVSYADLTAQSPFHPAMKVAERVLARVQDPSSPMPPGPAVTVPASELVPLQMWLMAGAPMVTCPTPVK